VKIVILSPMSLPTRVRCKQRLCDNFSYEILNLQTVINRELQEVVNKFTPQLISLILPMMKETCWVGSSVCE